MYLYINIDAIRKQGQAIKIITKIKKFKYGMRL